jgi:trimeric autotransporter adhesin
MSAQLQVTGEAKIRDIQGPVVANSGVITALDGAASQYVRGDGTLADFPTSTGGGSSVSYYLNSSVSQGTIGGVAYRELSKEPIIGAGTDIAISANGYVANYLTDANDPDVLSIPGGNFNCEFYFSVNNNTGNPTTYAELYKYDGTTFTLLGTSAGVPESINQGTTIAPYYFAIPVATAALSVTDRLAIRIYVNVDSRTVTLHTENGHLCQVVTTLSKGMVSLNNLTDQSQYLATGTSGTNFAIVSSGDTHTFNLPVASATNTGKLSSTDWSTFNGKVPYTGATTNVDLGTNDLTARFIYLNGTSTTGGNLFLRQDIGPAYLLGYTSIYATDENIGFGSSDGTNLKKAIFSFSSLTDNVLRTFTLPDLSGTLALTSQLTGGTVTSVGLSSATSGVTIGSSPITTSGTITLAIATASGSQNGLLSSTDWSTFNNKQNALTNPITGTGASGQVTFFNGTTNVIGSNNFFWDNTNSFLGIGTNVPSAGVTSFSTTPAFQFKAAGTAPAITFSNTLTSASLACVFGLATANNQFITGTAAGDMAIANQSTSAGAIVFGTGTTERMRMTSAGTLSIGNTNSTYKLDVTGIVRFTGELTGSSAVFSSTVRPASSFGADLGTSSFRWNDIYGFSLTLTSSVTALSIIKSGGTSSQFLKADGSVDTSTYLTTSAAASTYLALSGGTLTGFLSSTKSITTGDNGQISITPSTNTSAAFLQVTNIGGTTYFGRNNNSGTFLSSSPNATLIYSTDSSPIMLYTNGNQILTLTGGTPSVSGNVLINTSSDNGAKLQVSGTATFSSSVTAGGDISYYNGANLNAIITSGAAANGRMYIYSSANADIGFQAGGSSWFINNLGIGTSSPSQILDIVGTTPIINIQAGANTNGRGIQFNYNGASLTGSLMNYGATGETALSGGNTGSSGYFLTFKTDGSERMRITSGGQVYVGLTSGLNGTLNSTTLSGQFALSLFDGFGNNAMVTIRIVLMHK